MPVRYHKEYDILTIILESPVGKSTEFATGDFSVLVDDDTAEVVEIEIANASRFLNTVLVAGVAPPDRPDLQVKSTQPPWEDVESSMISAFRYDEGEGALDVVFTRTGVYRYSNVPAHVVDGLRRADSKGRYMRSNIIGLYYDTKLGS